MKDKQQKQEKKGTGSPCCCGTSAKAPQNTATPRPENPRPDQPKR